MPLFFLIPLALYLGGNIYIFVRAWQAFSPMPLLVGIIFSIVFWIVAVSFLVLILFREANIPTALAQAMYQIGTGWQAFLLYMVMLLLIVDILKLFHLQYTYSFHIVLGIVSVLLIYGYIHYKHPSTEVINIVINKPSQSYQQLKIVAISDIHVGYGTTKGDLKKYVDMINQQKPDLILIGGDLIDNSIIPVRQAGMQEELSQLKAPLGIYMVPGNHEYISGIEDCEKFITETPIHFLKDERVRHESGVQIIGRDDRTNLRRLPLTDLIQKADSDYPLLLIDHQPYNLQETVNAGIDLQFSGHTHRGQIWPVSLVTDRIFELSYGFRKMDNSYIYVSSGLSLWGPPFRIGTQSEMVVFNITFQPQE